MTFESPVKNPLRHVLRAYDRAIHACDRLDALAAHRAIALLRASHGNESPESLGFDSIFRWCELALVSGDFAGPQRRLTTLRNAWLDAEEVRHGARSGRGFHALHLVRETA